jgi:hypothetical protein
LLPKSESPNLKTSKWSEIALWSSREAFNIDFESLFSYHLRLLFEVYFVASYDTKGNVEYLIDSNPDVHESLVELPRFRLFFLSVQDIKLRFSFLFSFFFPVRFCFMYFKIKIIWQLSFNEDDRVVIIICTYAAIIFLFLFHKINKAVDIYSKWCFKM